MIVLSAFENSLITAIFSIRKKNGKMHFIFEIVELIETRFDVENESKKILNIFLKQ